MASVEVVAVAEVAAHVEVEVVDSVEEGALAEVVAIVTEEAMEAEVGHEEEGVTVEEVIAADVEEVGHHLAV